MQKKNRTKEQLNLTLTDQTAAKFVFPAKTGHAFSFEVALIQQSLAQRLPVFVLFVLAASKLVVRREPAKHLFRFLLKFVLVIRSITTFFIVEYI